MSHTANSFHSNVPLLDTVHVEGVKTVSILIADDDTVARRGLRSLLEEQPGWQVIAEAVHGQEAVERAGLLPDVIVMDTRVAQMNGWDAAQAILEASPTARVLILGEDRWQTTIEKALDIGALGYVHKADADIELIPAIRMLLHGGVFFPALALQHLRRHPQKEASTGTGSRLTQRETTIVQLVSEGRKNREIAHTLHISPRTVEAHRTKIMEKLGLRHISELVRYAVKYGIIEA